MTLNAVIKPLFCVFSPNSIALLANYVTVVEGISIMSVKYCLVVLIFHFWPKLTHPTARSHCLCDSWATCFQVVCSLLIQKCEKKFPRSEIYVVCHRYFITARFHHNAYLEQATSICNQYFSSFYRATAWNATHGIARPFCPSVCLSNVCIVTKRKKLVLTFSYYMKRPFILNFWQEALVGGGDPFYLKFWAKMLERKRQFSIDIRS